MALQTGTVKLPDCGATTMAATLSRPSNWISRLPPNKIREPRSRVRSVCSTTGNGVSRGNKGRKVTADPISVAGAPQVGVLCDVEGVLVSGNQALPGAAETVKWLVDSEVPHLFLTNTATNSTAGLVRRLQDLGIPCDAGGILTPASASCAWLQKNKKERIALFTCESLQPEFQELCPISDPKDGTEVDAIVVADMGDKWSYERLNTLFRLKMANPHATLISLGKTQYFKERDGGLSLDVGPFTAAMEFATGQEATVLGKPDAAFFRMGASQLGIGAGDVVMVGDDVKGDVGGAQSSGMNGVLVKTGKYMEGDLQRGVKPDGVIESIADLPTLLATRV